MSLNGDTRLILQDAFHPFCVVGLTVEDCGEFQAGRIFWLLLVSDNVQLSCEGAWFLSRFKLVVRCVLASVVLYGWAMNFWVEPFTGRRSPKRFFGTLQDPICG